LERAERKRHRRAANAQEDGEELLREGELIAGGKGADDGSAANQADQAPYGIVPKIHASLTTGGAS
jgi:hypothetical protein